MDRPDPCDLKPERLEQSLSGSLIGRRVVVLPSTTSTNDAAFELAEKGAEEGLVVFAEERWAGAIHLIHSITFPFESCGGESVLQPLASTARGWQTSLSISSFR